MVEVKKVIIVGAGPSGLLCGLMLAQAGIPVDILEAKDKFDSSPRALGYGSSAVQVLRRAGVLEKVRKAGIEVQSFSFRKLNGEKIASVARADLDNPDRPAVLPISLLNPILKEEIEKLPGACIHWKHKVINVGNDLEGAWILAQTPSGQQRFAADYVVGCDGANSAVRQALFGTSFPGFTWDEQLVATDIYYDIDKFGWDDTQFIISREHHSLIARINRDGLWRFTYSELGHLSYDDVKERLPLRFRKILPGHPEPDQYRISNFSPYKMHQRLAERMRVGRVLLAGDAAHLCNPFGGLGLTGGIADVGSLIDCLVGIHTGRANDDILDKYDEIRRQKWQNFTDPTSTRNLRRVTNDDEESIKKDPFLQYLTASSAGNNSTVELQAAELELVGDMTCFYVN
ncbi:uncharacterized protein Z520_02856 [Fonsecaea multimorphosa CBS 102226]|uniref:FAD-binding domain-containing protein n=1 Tax=Fonsecaea multimorphosa CBS 102226 TaxID=1442371 RepID=A0A0D2KWV7_9EURO|nr:uncharacterized protein Z520_02856 [Fonsecaea multimorphosa CBS 102226]KIY01304.1 hypothetical protein Z520_02856 [Fonsecaea multimorphosa CBS 102226]OAL28581.1 hypothetical protein AYO22_02775 [Fonsecaea multimorphosa]